MTLKRKHAQNMEHLDATSALLKYAVLKKRLNRPPVTTIAKYIEIRDESAGGVHPLLGLAILRFYTPVHIGRVWNPSEL